MKKYKILLLGAPGSGKGTISSLLTTKFNFIHLSTGDMFREELDGKGPLSEKINFFLEKGILVTDEITNELVKNKLNSLSNDNRSIILDGYPRNLNQAIFLESYFELSHVFYLNVDEDLIIKRITGRMNCPICKKNYNEYFMPPKVIGKCDNDGTNLTKRKDDNFETLKTRLDTYKELTFPLVDYYKNKNFLFNVNVEDDLDKIIESIKIHLKLE